MATTNKHISSFEYLGSKIDELGRTEADVKSRVNKARQVFASLNKSGIPDLSIFKRS